MQKSMAALSGEASSPPAVAAPNQKASGGNAWFAEQTGSKPAVSEAEFSSCKSSIRQRIFSQYAEFTDKKSPKYNGETAQRLATFSRALDEFSLQDCLRLEPKFSFEPSVNEGKAPREFSAEQKTFLVFSGFYGLWLWGEQNAPELGMKNSKSEWAFEPVEFHPAGYTFPSLEGEFEKNGISFSKSQAAAIKDFPESSNVKSILATSEDGRRYLLQKDNDRVIVSTPAEADNLFYSRLSDRARNASSGDGSFPFVIVHAAALAKDDPQSWVEAMNQLIHECSHAVGLMRSSREAVAQLPSDAEAAIKMVEEKLKTTLDMFARPDFIANFSMLREGEATVLILTGMDDKYVIKKTGGKISLCGPYGEYWELGSALAVQNFALPSPDAYYVKRGKPEYQHGTRLAWEYLRLHPPKGAQGELHMPDYLSYYMAPLLFPDVLGDKGKLLDEMRHPPAELGRLLWGTFLEDLDSKSWISSLDGEKGKAKLEAFLSDARKLMGDTADYRFIEKKLRETISKVDPGDTSRIEEILAKLKLDINEYLMKKYGKVLPEGFTYAPPKRNGGKSAS